MNKNKLIIQIKLAMYEKKTGRTAEQLEKSRKSSYVFRGVVWTFISITISYILCRIIYTMIFGDIGQSFSNFMNNPLLLFSKFHDFLIYGIAEGVFILIAIGIYSKRYYLKVSELRTYLKRRNYIESTNNEETTGQ